MQVSRTFEKLAQWTSDNLFLQGLNPGATGQKHTQDRCQSGSSHPQPIPGTCCPRQTTHQNSWRRAGPHPSTWETSGPHANLLNPLAPRDLGVRGTPPHHHRSFGQGLTCPHPQEPRDVAGFRHPPPLGIAAELRPRPSEMQAHIPNMTSGRARPEPRQRVPPPPPLPSTRTVPSLRPSQQPRLSGPTFPRREGHGCGLEPLGRHTHQRGTRGHCSHQLGQDARTTLPRILGPAPGLHLPGWSARPEAFQGTVSR